MVPLFSWDIRRLLVYSQGPSGPETTVAFSALLLKQLLDKGVVSAGGQPWEGCRGEKGHRDSGESSRGRDRSTPQLHALVLTRNREITSTILVGRPTLDSDWGDSVASSVPRDLVISSLWESYGNTSWCHCSGSFKVMVCLLLHLMSFWLKGRTFICSSHDSPWYPVQADSVHLHFSGMSSKCHCIDPPITASHLSKPVKHFSSQHPPHLLRP